MSYLLGMGDFGPHFQSSVQKWEDECNDCVRPTVRPSVRLSFILFQLQKTTVAMKRKLAWYQNATRVSQSRLFQEIEKSSSKYMI